MPNKRILPDTVVIENYVGEVDDVAEYQITTISRCYCSANEGTELDSSGNRKSNSARLYIFDKDSVAQSEYGTRRTYLPYEQWALIDDKSKYWTISDRGYDYFIKNGTGGKFRIYSWSHKVNGSRRMWHFEVDGR